MAEGLKSISEWKAHYKSFVTITNNNNVKSNYRTNGVK